MKLLVRNIGLLLFCLVVLACNFKQEVANSVSNDENDIRIVSPNVRFRYIANTTDRKCCEYFMVENNDTFTYSFVVRNFMHSDEFCLDVSDMEHRGRTYKKKDIDGIMNEFDSCLCAMSSSYNMDSLKFVGMSLIILGDVTVEFNKALGKNELSKGCVFPENYYRQHPEKLLSAVKATSLSDRVDSVLKKYGLHICDAVAKSGLSVDKGRFLLDNIVSDSSLVPHRLMLTYVRYKCEVYKH